MTISDLWELYQPVSERDNDSWRTEKTRVAHLVRHLGSKDASQLGLADVEAYRTARRRETSKRGSPPAWGTLDRELELLKRLLGYGVKCRRLSMNPLADVKLLNKSNVRRNVITPPEFDALLAAADQRIKCLLVMAFDTGCRIGELLTLRWEQVDLDGGSIQLWDTKTDEPRKVYLTDRAKLWLEQQPKNSPRGWVFSNPKTGERLFDVRKSFHTAAKAIGRPELWFHDLRRSFVTRARRAGIPESVVMRMSGHKTPMVFRRYNIIFDSDVQDAAKQLDGEK